MVTFPYLIVMKVVFYKTLNSRKNSSNQSNENPNERIKTLIYNKRVDRKRLETTKNNTIVEIQGMNKYKQIVKNFKGKETAIAILR